MTNPTPDLFHIRTWLESLVEQNSPYARDVLKMLDATAHPSPEAGACNIEYIGRMSHDSGGNYIFTCHTHIPHNFTSSQRDVTHCPAAAGAAELEYLKQVTPCGHLRQYRYIAAGELGERCALCEATAAPENGRGEGA